MYAGGGIPDRQDAVMLPNGVSGLTMLELRKGVYAAVSSWPEGMYSLKDFLSTCPQLTKLRQ